MDNKKDKIDLGGFEELFEDYISTEKAKSQLRESKDSKDNDSFELERFLEIENERLTNIETFFTKKIPNKIHFPQSEKLLKIQECRIEEVKNKVLLKIDRQDSVILKNLAKIFDHNFT